MASWKRALGALAVSLSLLPLTATTSAVRAQFEISGQQSPPLPRGMTVAVEYAMGYMRIAMACTAEPQMGATLHAAANELLVVGGYEPAGARVVLEELTRTATGEAWTRDNCTREFGNFEATHAQNRGRVADVARGGSAAFDR